jgi:hypothetical protein
MAKAKKVKKDKAPFLSRVKDACVDGITSTLAFNHLMLKYTTDAVENMEAYVSFKAYGVDKQDTIKHRQAKSVLMQLQVKKKIADVTAKIHDFVDVDLKGQDDAVNETAVYNDVN